MKILVSWLKDYIETDLNAAKMAEILSDLGFPNEGIEYLSDGDAVIDLEVTSNRGDCLGYIGVARELSAFTGGKLKLPQVNLPESAKKACDLVKVQIEQPSACRRYTARVIEGVKVGPSPDWVVKRLEAAGQRSVSNVVDATNYAMLETGQPPHAFDYSKIKNGSIIVRNAKPGERITSIDGTRCDLEPCMLVIADDGGPVAIAGVMGGLDSEVSYTTTTILLEDAHFAPITVRTASKKLGLPSEAAYRFERNVDIENIEWASKRTAQLIAKWAGAKVAQGVVDAYPGRQEPLEVCLRLSRMNAVLGIEVPAEMACDILSRLGFSPVLKDNCICCAIPSWRWADVSREADLIEEVARVYGYNKVPVESKVRIEIAPVDARQKLFGEVRTWLQACGFYESINVTFTDDATAAIFSGGIEKHLAVKEVSRKSANKLRQTLLGSLFGVMKTNLNAKMSPCKIYEIADTFLPANEFSLPHEHMKLALTCDSDMRVVKGAVEGLISRICRDRKVGFEPVELGWANAAAMITVDGKEIGQIGLTGKSVNDCFDFKETAVSFAELDLDVLSELQTGIPRVKPIPRFPAIERDLSILVDEQVAWKQIEAVVGAAAPNELEGVTFVDLYRGKGIPAGKKSITLSLRFRDEQGTLTHDTVDTFEKDILTSLVSKTGAELRTA